MTAAERKVRERYPEAKSRGPIHLSGGREMYEVTTTRESGIGYRTLGAGQSRALAWSDAASRLPTEEDVST